MLSIRSASLSGYVALAQSLRLDAFALMRRVGLSPRCLDNPETPISASAVRDLLELSAQQSATEDFALRLAASRSLSNLGPLSLILREERTARDALDTLCRYLRLLNASLITRIEEAGDAVVIREDILVPQRGSMRQSMEMALGVMHRILRDLLGEDWRPMRVFFTHRAPQSLAAHRLFFGAPVVFNQEFNGLMCAAKDLQLTLVNPNPVLSKFARHYLEQALNRQHSDPAHTVRQLITALLPGGRCTAAQVAQHLGVDRRTVHRSLAQHGLNFSRLLNQVRTELALRQLKDSDMSIAELASLLGFSTSSPFCHWFRTQFGSSITLWLRQQTGAVARRRLAK